MTLGDHNSGTAVYMPTHQVGEMQAYPGIDYLGIGYDLIRGNPRGNPQDMLDPGFRQPVRTADYTENWLTRDGKYRTPTGSYALPLKSCSRSQQYKNVASKESYAFSLAIDVALTASYEGWGTSTAFSASLGYKEASNQATFGESYRFDSESYCNKYFAAWCVMRPKQQSTTNKSPRPVLSLYDRSSPDALFQSSPPPCRLHSEPTKAECDVLSEGEDGCDGKKAEWQRQKRVHDDLLIPAAETERATDEQIQQAAAAEKQANDVYKACKEQAKTVDDLKHKGCDALTPQVRSTILHTHWNTSPLMILHGPCASLTLVVLGPVSRCCPQHHGPAELLTSRRALLYG